MVYKKKTWKEKLQDNKKFPKILKFNPKFPCGKALEKMGAKSGDTVVLAPPLEVDQIMRRIPKGKLITIYEICKELALKYNAKFCCTLTTGIFITIAANAAKEDMDNGKKNVTPYWRTLKMEGVLNDKYPGGIEVQRKFLEKEGFKIITKGKTHFVNNFKEYIINM
jgi:alkylated DNA nucleotide flippase Atl1